MEVAKIFVSNNLAHVRYLEPITSGTIGATVSFKFDETWDGWNKMYVFRSGCKTLDDTNATGIIPAELLEPGLRLEVGVYGTKGEIALPTIWADLGVIRSGADPSGDESTDPALPVWAQLQAQIEELKQSGGGGTGSGLPAVTEEDNGKIAKVVNGKWVAAELPAYDGEYSVTPSATEDQVLKTAQTYMDADIKIEKIPYSEVLNNSGGVTVNIGG